jgi:hypothetical protein
MDEYTCGARWRYVEMIDESDVTTGLSDNENEGSIVEGSTSTNKFKPPVTNDTELINTSRIHLVNS